MKTKEKLKLLEEEYEEMFENYEYTLGCLRRCMVMLGEEIKKVEKLEWEKEVV
jgi:hypothetical protein